MAKTGGGWEIIRCFDFSKSEGFCKEERGRKHVTTLYLLAKVDAILGNVGKIVDQIYPPF
jgi:hypothetical protein